MFLAIREIKHSRLRYLMLSVIMVLLAWLVFLLSGLANGLAADNASSFQNMKADYLVFQTGSRLSLSRSLLEKTSVQQIQQIPGVVAATPLGQQTLTVEIGNGAKVDIAILALDFNSFLAPKVTEGQALTPETVLVDARLKRENVKLGDTLKLSTTGQFLTIGGFTSGQTYGHLPVVFMDISRWQAIKFANPAAKGQLTDPISAIAVQMDKETAERVKTLPGLEVVTREAAIQKLPGYSEESGTLTLIQVFLLIITAFIMAAFFYVITLQKTNQLGVLKALGASARFLTFDLLSQAILLAVGGVILGALLSYGVAIVIPASVPFLLDSLLVLSYGAVLLGVALLGTFLSLFRISKIDPLIAIGRAD